MQPDSQCEYCLKRIHKAEGLWFDDRGRAYCGSGLSDFHGPEKAKPPGRLYLLQLRGKCHTPEGRAMIVRAPSEAHARVLAADVSSPPDIRWACNGNSACQEVSKGEGVLHTIYAGELP